MKSDSIEIAAKRFVECLSGTGPQAKACTALLAWAEFELSGDQDYLVLNADEPRLLYVANKSRAALRELEAYQAKRKIDEGASNADIISGKAIHPAYDLHRSHCWLAAPRLDRLGRCAVRLVLESFAGMTSEKNIVFVLPEGACIDERVLRWAKLLNEALDGPRARLLRVTWVAEGWGRGLDFGDGIQLASRQGAAVQRLVDAVSGEAFVLRLRLIDGPSEQKRAYQLDLTYDKVTPKQSVVPDPFVLPANIYKLVPEGTVERLQVDTAARLFVAKFENEHHLLEFDSWTHSWEMPEAVRLFGESGYDRAYYIGQGCWEDMEDLPEVAVRAILANGWLGYACLKGDALCVALPSGERLTINRKTGELLGAEWVPTSRKKGPGSRRKRFSSRRLIQIFNDTRMVTRQRAYWCDKELVSLNRSSEELAQAQVLCAADVEALVAHPNYPIAHARSGRCAVQVTEEDSLRGAYALTQYRGNGQAPLVLNFANPYEPGGGVTRGARAQEEDICRRSTLYASIASPAAKAYYQENSATDSRLFTHNAILSPHVLVFRDADGSFLQKPFEIAVLTMAAPYAPGLFGVTQEELRATIKTRVLGLLHLAASSGYTRVVLGAWGCGAFGNDPNLVSTVFREALLEFRVGATEEYAFGLPFNAVCEQVRFAVPPGPNHRVFAQTLGNLRLEEAPQEPGSAS